MLVYNNHCATPYMRGVMADCIGWQSQSVSSTGSYPTPFFASTPPLDNRRTLSFVYGTSWVGGISVPSDPVPASFSVYDVDREQRKLTRLDSNAQTDTFTFSTLGQHIWVNHFDLGQYNFEYIRGRMPEFRAMVSDTSCMPRNYMGSPFYSSYCIDMRNSFNNCKRMTGIGTIPSKVQTATDVFRNTRIYNANIGTGVQTINNCYRDCRILGGQLNLNIPYCRSMVGAFCNTSIWSYRLVNTDNIRQMDECFYNCTGLIEISIPNRCTSMANAFAYTNAINHQYQVYFRCDSLTSFDNAFLGRSEDAEEMHLFCKNVKSDTYKLLRDRCTLFGPALTWSEETDWFYNAMYNVYLMKNPL